MAQSLADMTRLAILAIDAMALLLIVVGTVEAFVAGARVFLGARSSHERRAVWLRYTHWLVAALTFQLAADILETSITTRWEDVARLAIIAVIRTMLNYFLERDLAEVRTLESHEEHTRPKGATQAES